MTDSWSVDSDWFSPCAIGTNWECARFSPWDSDTLAIESEWDDSDWLSPCNVECQDLAPLWYLDVRTLTNNQEEYFQNVGIDPFNLPEDWDEDSGNEADTE